jgi:tetratricopeptide (TPR) repeat protein
VRGWKPTLSPSDPPRTRPIAWAPKGSRPYGSARKTSTRLKRGLLVDDVRAVAADRARSDRGPFGVVGGPLDPFAFALPAALEVLEVDALAVAVRDGVGLPAFGLGDLERALGNYEQAATLLQRSFELARAGGDPEDMNRPLHGLGDLALAQGALGTAVARYREALLLVADLPAGERGFCYCLGGLASVAARRGDATCAGRLWGVVEAQIALYPLFPETKQRYEEAFAELDHGSFARGYDEGSTWSLREGVAYALASIN